MLKRYPYIRQSGIKDCAAASVWMIVKYYKGHISMDKLNIMLKTTRNGTTAYHIIQTLKDLGFKAEGLKIQSLKKIKTPFIAHVIIDKIYKHYLVVYEISKNYILVADPATKIKKISHKDFYQIWTSVIITMYPQRPIVKEKNIPPLSFLREVLKPYKFTIIKFGILSFIITILAIISSFFFQSIIDNPNKFVVISIAFFLCIVVRLLITHFRNILLIHFTNNIDQKLSEDTFKRILELPYLYYRNHTTGEVISRLNDLNILKDLIGKFIISIFIDIPLTLFSGILLLYINKTLFIVALLILISNIVVILSFHIKIYALIDNMQQKKSLVSSYMVETIKGFETIKGINIIDKTKETFSTKYQSYINSNLKLNNLINTQTLLKDTINLFGQAFIIAYGMTLVNNNTISLSTLITFTTLASLFLEPIRNIVDLDLEIKQALNSLRRVLELFENNAQIIEKPIKGDIELKNVSYSFDTINYVLKNINLIIKDKSKVLITGPSGSGKSTLLKILKGYYDYEGIVTIRNENIKAPPNIIYISQKELLFTGTIHDNLCIKGNKGLKKRVKICHVDEIINTSELGYNTLIEEDGFNVSAGQKQRIALARSLNNFDILLVDEGLNSLNSDLERKILKKIFEQYKNKTIIIVSHRLENLDLFDHYIKIENGNIVLDEKYNN